MNLDPVPSDSALQPALAALVVKTGMGLGVMTQSERELALAVPAMALSCSRPLSESEVNALLKKALSEEAAFLDVDHVELRRWLVDTGWWQRDGFGRLYARTAQDSLPPALQRITHALRDLDLRAWIGLAREAHERIRRERRAAWTASRDGQSHG